MGRAPCCDKANVKKGPWSPEEDAKLKSYIEQQGTGGNWIALPQKIGLKRCGKSCRLRWLNYLRPNIKHGGFSEEEDNIICSLYISIGSRWSIIAAQLPGRTDNDIKNYWNTRLKKKLLGKQRKGQQASRRGQKQQIMKAEINKHNLINNNNYNNMVLAPNYTLNTINHQSNGYWPELPVLAPRRYTQEPRRNDHASIRKLLIKLGGRFSNNDDEFIHNSTSCTQLEFPSLDPNLPYNPISTTTTTTTSSQSFCDQHINVCPEEIPTTSSGHIQLVQTSYNVGGIQMLQGQSSGFTSELEELMACNTTTTTTTTTATSSTLDGLEFLLADMDAMKYNKTTGSSVSTNGHDHSIIGSLGGMDSLVYGPPLASINIEGLRENLPQDCDLDDLMRCSTGLL